MALVAVVLVVESVSALAQGGRPLSSVAAMAAAAVSVVVLTPLAVAKRRLGTRMSSRALRGDGTLSGIGAATGLIALVALIVYRLLGWWWADQLAASVVAAVAAAEAWHTAPRH
jgi:divalent metal cation (Fe/Co/Zn/Cd) transporter